MRFRPFTGLALMAALSFDDRSALLKALQLQVQQNSKNKMEMGLVLTQHILPRYLTNSRPRPSLSTCYMKMVSFRSDGSCWGNGLVCEIGTLQFPNCISNQHQLTIFFLCQFGPNFIFCGNFYLYSGIWGSSVFLCDTVFAGWCYPGVWGLRLELFQN